MRRGETPHVVYQLGDSVNGVGFTSDIYIDGDLYIIKNCFDGYNTDGFTITPLEYKFGYTTDGQGFTTSNFVVDGDVFVRENLH